MDSAEPAIGDGTELGLCGAGLGLWHTPRAVCRMTSSCCMGLLSELPSCSICQPLNGGENWVWVQAAEQEEGTGNGQGLAEVEHMWTLR